MAAITTGLLGSGRAKCPGLRVTVGFLTDFIHGMDIAPRSLAIDGVIASKEGSSCVT